MSKFCYDVCAGVERDILFSHSKKYLPSEKRKKQSRCLKNALRKGKCIEPFDECFFNSLQMESIPNIYILVPYFDRV